MLLHQVTSATVISRADGGLEIDVVGADACGDCELEVGRFGDSLRCQVCRPERLRDHNVGIKYLAVEYGVGAVLVGRDDELMALGRNKVLKAQAAGDGAQKLAGREIDCRG